MSGSKLTGKTKGDLIEIAHLSGLLTARETSRMTKAQLLNFLLKVEEESESGLIVAADAEAAADAAEEIKPPTAARTRRTAKQAAEQAEEKAGEEIEIKPKRRGRPPKKTKAASSEEQPVKEPDTISEKALATDKSVDEKTLESQASVPVQTELGQATGATVQSEDAPKSRAKNAGKTATAKKSSAKTKQTSRGRKKQIELTEVLEPEEAVPDRAGAMKEKSSRDDSAGDKVTAGTAKESAIETATAESVTETAEETVQTAAKDLAEYGKKAKTKIKHGPKEKGTAERAENSEHEAGHAKETEPPEIVSGVLEIMPDGYGFLRKDNYLQGNHDIYVPPQYIRRFNLRNGDLLVGPARQQRETDRYQALYYIKEVNGLTPDKMFRRPHFDRLTPIYPNERFILETGRTELSTRIIDLIAPIGKGQRGMIVSPPKAGKTILMQKIANAISHNNPEAKLIVLLIDERPEEVTDMQRSIDGEVVYSTFDKTPENHVKVTELVLERAMRLVELGEDVVILLDSITRMARAYNLTINPTGRTLSGGLDPGALYGPKRFFGAARNIEHGGSLTIIATALIDTGSRMDEVIFEEFKGTGNMEVYLDRKLSEKRIFPAIDINRSSTRREDLLLSPTELDSVWAIRKAFGQLDTAAVTETIISLLLKTKNNSQFITSVNVSFNDKAVFDAMRGSAKTGNMNGSNNNSNH